MTTESFNHVFKGVRALPVSGIVQFSFRKCDEYFVNRRGTWPPTGYGKRQEKNICTKQRFGLINKCARLLDRTGWCIVWNEFLCSGSLCTGPRGSWPRVAAAAGYCRGSGSRGHNALGGERFGGRNYREDLERVECTCNIPQIMHAPRSHTIATCRARGLYYTGPAYMCPIGLEF
jgi:hypothetical protein